MKVFKNRKVLLLLFVVFAALITFIGISYSAILDNDVEVKLDTNLTYYLETDVNRLIINFNNYSARKDDYNRIAAIVLCSEEGTCG